MNVLTMSEGSEINTKKEIIKVCASFPLASVKDTLWVLAPNTLGLCVFPNIFAIYGCKLT